MPIYIIATSCKCVLFDEANILRQDLFLKEKRNSIFVNSSEDSIPVV